SHLRLGGREGLRRSAEIVRTVPRGVLALSDTGRRFGGILISMVTATDSVRSRSRSWLWFAAWALVGAAGTLGSVSFALWIFLLPPALIGATVLGTRRAARGSIA